LSIQTMFGYCWPRKFTPQLTILREVYLTSNLLFTKYSRTYDSLYKIKTLPTKLNRVNTTLPAGNFDTLELRFIHTFKIFLQFSSGTTNKTFPLHPSWFVNFIRYKGAAVYYINIYKFFEQWKRMYYLLFNLFYYKVRILYFGNVFFRKEIIALNWTSNTFIKHLWRYVVPFFTVKPIKIFNYGWLIFHKLKLSGFNVSIVCDVLYHNKTIHYLNTESFYTVGLVPTIYKRDTVNVAIPASTDNIFSQLFFMKFLTTIRKSAEESRYNYLRNLWKLI